MSAQSLAAGALRWLNESGIATAEAGGTRLCLRREYDASTRRYADCYPEVTAYAVQLMLRLARGAAQRDGARPERRAALRAAEWLAEVQTRGPAAVDGAYAHAIRDGRPLGGWYAFDTAIVAHALLETGLACARPDLLAAAGRAAEWLLGMQNDDGSFRACAGAPAAISWAGDAACLHGKHALALAAFWRASGESRYRDAARRLIDWLPRLQGEDGRIEVRAGARYAILHTQCYAVEGLLAAGLWLDLPEALERARRGAAFLARCQRASGALPRYAGPGADAYLREAGARLPALRRFLAPADVGATAQALRIWIWLRQLGGERHDDAIARGFGWLERQQFDTPDPVLYGGFPAGTDDFLGLNRREPRLYPWVAIFAADAARLLSSPDPAPDLF